MCYTNIMNSANPIYKGQVTVSIEEEGFYKYVFSLGEETYAMVYESAHGGYILYSTPLYGGEEQFEKSCKTLEECIWHFSSWT